MPTDVLLISLMVSCTPLAAFLIFRYWLGRHDREPHSIIALAFVWGAVGGIFFGLTGSELISKVLLVLRAPALLDLFLSGPLAEELAKGLVLLLLFPTTRFEHTTSGLFYGAATGLGFVMTENMVYFLSAYTVGGADDWRSSLVIRTAFSACIHTTAGATFGYILGQARDARSWPLRWAGALLGLAVAVSIHAMWNGTLLAGQAARDQSVPIRLFAQVPLVVALLLLLFEIALRSEARIILQELQEESAAGLIPQGQAEILSEHRRRRGSAWLPAGVRRAAYVRGLLTLALRKHQALVLEQAGSAAAAAACRDDAAALRRGIQGMLVRDMSHEIVVS